MTNETPKADYYDEEDEKIVSYDLHMKILDAIEAQLPISAEFEITGDLAEWLNCFVEEPVDLVKKHLALKKYELRDLLATQYTPFTFDIARVMADIDEAFAAELAA